MFDGAGTKVTEPASWGFNYLLPTGDSVGGAWPVGNGPHVEPDGSIVLMMHVDDRDTEADILSVSPVGVLSSEW